MIDKKLIALLMMVKNEEARITVSFDSVKELVDTFILLDTGSTDNTIQIARDYCKKNNINLHIKEEPFVNFEVSRNVSLNFADEVCSKIGDRYILLLDCNDELRNVNELYKYIKDYKGDATGFHLKQNWWTGITMDSYWNMRFVKSNCGWRYKGVVHEYMMNVKYDKKDSDKLVERINGPILFQDRTKDDDKSSKRFFRDKELLYPEHLKDPKDPRTLFYLAQTCSCLGHHQEGYKYYLLRLKAGGFEEEIYHSYYRLGETSRALEHPWEESMVWYMKAFSHSQRVEPLIRIIEHYKDNNINGEKKPEYLTAYLFCDMACKLLFPYNQILFIDRRSYDYTRWHLLGELAYHVGRYKEGKEGCLRALEFEETQKDMDNLVRYMKRERELNGILDKNRMEEMVQKVEFQYLLPISVNGNEVTPVIEQPERKNNRQDIITKATKLILEEIKKK